MIKPGRLRSFLGGAFFTGALSFGLYQAMRPRPFAFPLQNKPALNYEQAVARLQALQRQEKSEAINPLCHTRLFDQGGMSQEAIVLIHGYTNCPQQFRQLAPLLHERGYNVLMARLPKHGWQDRLLGARAVASSQEVARLVEDVVDIAHGLGQRVTVLGFSFGGVLAAWLAQRRSDIDRVILVSPALAIHGIPFRLRHFYANLFAVLPNTFQWWDAEAKDARTGPQHAYPGWSTRPLGVMLRFIGDVERQAQRAKPAAKSITLIDNPSDDVVDNRASAALLARWRQHGGQVRNLHFPAEWNLLHDLIDPDQPEQQVERVYPLLLRLLEE